MIAILGSADQRGGSSRLRPSVAALLAYLGTLLVLEILAETFFIGGPPPVRALMHWSLIALSIAPVCWLIIRRGMQAERELAAGAERDSIRKLVERLSAETEPERIPVLLVRQPLELTGARAAFLALPDDAGYRVAVLAGDGPQRLVDQVLPITPTAPGLAGNALRSGKSSILPDTWCDAGLAARRELALSDKIRSAAAVPLVVRNKVVALIGLYGDAVNQLHPGQAELLDLWAQQAAGAFENARLAASVSQIDAAKQLDQLKTEFISAVAHELRAPLSPMLGWSEMLLGRDYPPEQTRIMLQNIHDGAKHLAVLVSDLLDLTRGEAGRMQLELMDIQMDRLLEDAVERWRVEAPKHNFILAAAAPLEARADQHRLRQVLDNLLSNAAKYSQPSSRILVTARVDERRQIVIRVSDQGLGLSADECAHMFTKFYRTDSARRQATGTGLGLALCRLIVEAHGGQIGVESEGPGKGSAFTFSVPAAGPGADSRKASVDFMAIRG